MQNIAYNIRALRKAKGLTQEDLAARLHVTRQAVSSWERGGSCPDFDTLKALAEILEATPEQLLYGTDRKKPRKMKRVAYEKGIIASLLLGTLCFVGLGYIGLAIFFAVLIPFCTCLILDEIRNGAYWQTYQESMEQPEPTQDNE